MKAAWLVLLAALAFAAPADAATIAVTTTDDEPPPGCSAEHCSLRQALAVAQPGDEISVPPSAQPYKLRADLGQLVVAQGGVRIAGTDARRTIVGGGGATRVFAIAEGVGGVTISGLTITGGAATADPRGGGVYVGPRAELTLRDAAVVRNSAGPGTLGGFGGGIFNAGTLVLERVLVADNLAGGTGIALGQGGGIYNQAALRATNVTIARNTAGGALALSRGGGVFTGAPGTSRLTNATVVANRAAVIGTGANLYSDAARAELRNTIVAGAVGAPSCGGGVTSLGHNLEDRTGCGLGGPRNLRLGQLQDNGGPTDTRLPQADSPALDAGEACAQTDQRGVPRPQGGGCDIGAAEREVAAAAIAPPQRNATVNLSSAAGRVLYQVPGGTRFVRLAATQQVPLGTLVNTEDGVVALAAARDDAGTVDSAKFFDGTFAVRQERSGAGRSVTVVTLRGDEPSDCAAEPKASAAAKKKKKKPRRVWGSGKGTFRTEGRHSSATVRGTRWLTEDTCDGTLTRVREGVVDVYDFALRKHVRVRAGSSYLARPYRCESRRRFHISVPVARKLRVRRATALVGGRRVRLLREQRSVTGVVDLRGLPMGSFTVRVTIVLAGGRVLHDTRTYRTCRAD